MRPSTPAACCVVGVLLSGVYAGQPVRAQGEAPERRDLWTVTVGAAAARERGDWQEVRAIYDRAVAVAPGHPGVHARRAEALAHLGDLPGALAGLERVAALGGVTELLAEAVFAGTADGERARRIAERLAENASPRGAAEVVVRFEDQELFPEGIAADPETGELYVGSFHRSRILRVGPDETVTTLGDPAVQGLRAVLGLWVDGARRELWAVSVEGGEGADAEPPELVRLALPGGNVVGRYPTPADGVARMLNDIAVAPDGTAWVTESLEGGLWRLPPGGEALQLFRATPDFGFANGIAVAADGRTVWVAHTEGLSAIDARSGEIARVTGPEELSLVGADGLSVAPGGLVLVQNQPSLGNRTILVELAEDGRSALGHSLLATGVPDGLLPFTSAVLGEWVYLVASPPFDLLGGEEEIPPPAVVRCRLP